MELFTFTVNPFQENTYLLIEQGRAVIVDPGFMELAEFQEFEKVLTENKAHPESIILTHAHIDHILGVGSLHRKYGVPVYLHSDDRIFWDQIESQAAFFGVTAEALEFEPNEIKPMQEWKTGPFTFEVRFTPGHSPGHVVFYLRNEGILLGGDTVFRESIGRTDLYMGDFKQLENSIRTQIYTLPGETRILPGHGPETTVSYEMTNNPFVR